MYPRIRSLIALGILPVFLLSACHKPERIKASSARDSSLNCQQIRQEINKAERAKTAAREHDQFEMRYILLVPAIFSMYNFHKAEKAAEERMDNMHNLYARKDCANKPNRPPQQTRQPYGTFPGQQQPGQFQQRSGQQPGQFQQQQRYAPQNAPSGFTSQQQRYNPQQGYTPQQGYSAPPQSPQTQPYGQPNPSGQSEQRPPPQAFDPSMLMDSGID